MHVPTTHCPLSGASATSEGKKQQLEKKFQAYRMRKLFNKNQIQSFKKKQDLRKQQNQHTKASFLKKFAN
jgi:hypothetical protein